MNIAKLIKQVSACRLEQFKLDVEPFDFDSTDAARLIAELNQKQWQSANLYWCDGSSTSGICDYFLKFLQQTSIRQIQFFIPIAFSDEEMKILQAAIKAIKAADDSFQIKLREIPGVLAKSVFPNLLFKLANDKLDTQTITIPVTSIYLDEDDYNEEDFQADLVKLVNSGKFTKLVIKWNEENDTILDENLGTWLEQLIYWVANNSQAMTHFEIDMSEKDVCIEHQKFAEYIARYANANFQQRKDIKREFSVLKTKTPNVHNLRLFVHEERAQASQLKKKSSHEREKENKSKLSTESFHVDELIDKDEVTGGLECR